MKKKIGFWAGITLFLVFYGLALGGGQEKAGSAQPFDVATVHFEQNATDGDVEVVFQVKGGDEGLAKLTVVSPDGRKVVDFSAPDASTLGIRQFRFESPEPGDVQGLKAAYPEGAYTFDGVAVGGDKFHSESALNHRLPATASFVQPGPDAEDVSFVDLEMTWTPVKNLDAYIIELDQEDTNVNMVVTLPGNATTFAIPNNFLRPGTEYKLGIGTRTEDGNSSFVETSFTTADEE